MKTALLGQLSLVLSFMLSGCYKEPRQRGTFTFSGRLIDDRSGAPIAGHYFQVDLEVSPDYAPHNSNHYDIGHGTTDANGYFNFECAYFKTPHEKRYSLGSGNWSDYVGYWTFEMRDRQADVGTLYDVRYEASYFVKVLRAIRPQDSLLVGYDGTRVDAIFPILENTAYKTIYHVGIVGRTYPQRDTFLAAIPWGIGQDEFFRASNSYAPNPISQRTPLIFFRRFTSHSDTIVIR